MKIAIVGAGLSGLVCADKLAANGHQVQLFDKGRGPGGRMSTRRIETAQGEVSFDHGAQYFTASDPTFQAAVTKWQERGLINRWSSVGEKMWVGVPTMNAPVKYLASRHEVKWATRIEKLSYAEDHWHLITEDDPCGSLFDAAIVAVPAEQAAPLLAPWNSAFSEQAASIRSAPCWTVMLAFDRPLSATETFICDDEVIAWAARNSDKPGRGPIESWVIQASAKWSAAHLENNPEEVCAQLCDRLFDTLSLSQLRPLSAIAHRWRYALPESSDRQALYDKDMQLGVCGDWLSGPKVECAWLSGSALASKIIT